MDTDPCSAPVALSNSFEVINTRLEQRTATVRWSQLAPECQNGPQPGYEISMLDIQGTQLYIYSAEVVLFSVVINYFFFWFSRSSRQLSAADLTSISFDNLDREKAYQFVLLSRNDVGYSPNSSQVFLPMTSNSKFQIYFISLVDLLTICNNLITNATTFLLSEY